MNNVYKKLQSFPLKKKRKKESNIKKEREEKTNLYLIIKSRNFARHFRETN